MTSLAEKSKKAGLNYNTVRSRIYTHGWSEKDALTVPIQKHHPVSEMMIGKIYGSLLVLDIAEKKDKRGNAIVKVQCLCGHQNCRGKCEVLANNVRSGATKSCGAAYGFDGRHIKHGECRTRLHKCWRDMRCRSNNAPSVQKRHGDTYLNVSRDESWDSYEKFRDWALSNGYSDDKVLHRINNMPHYGERTCKWVTRAEHRVIHSELAKNNKEIIRN